MKLDIDRLMSEMTLEEKASLCSGYDNWHTKPIDRLGLPSIMLADGPHGLRKQEMTGDYQSINDSIIAVCFPTGPGLAASFDRDLVYRMGEALGNECQAENVQVLLGPGANIKRSPLCGRNFEYFSEDPVLTAEIAAALIKGVQSKNVGTSLKHFATNNQETRRMAVSAEIDERTLREIYWANYERAVKKSQPWTIMTSYNKTNGVYGSENPLTLTQLLREEWGFEGFVMTDWGAVNDHVAGVAAGCELEMPASGKFTDQLLADAVREGRLPMETLDRAVRRLLKIIDQALSNRDEKAVFDRAADHALARQICAETITLLKNDHDILPLKPSAKIAYIGCYAKKPRFQGGGSSHINPFRVDSAVDTASEFGANITYAQGFDDDTDAVNPARQAEAIELAKQSDIAVIFAGLPNVFESEGYDRDHMRMPKCQDELIRAIRAVQPNVVVVLHNGSPVEMPWADDVPAILEAYLGGEAVGGAVNDVLFGKVNPSGKLAETFPTHLEQNPSHLNFPGETLTVEYREGVFVGYRYYDTKKLTPRFPFGHGLSYTSFRYENARIESFDADSANVIVAVDVINTGNRAGKETVQLYVAPKVPVKMRPAQELKEFAKIALEAGETKTVRFTLARRDFAYWESEIHDWYVEKGTYELRFAASSRDIRVALEVQLSGDPLLPIPLTPDTIIGDMYRFPGAPKVLSPILKGVAMAFLPDDYDLEEAIEKLDPMILNMMLGMPIHSMRSWMQDRYDPAVMEKVLAEFKTLMAKVTKRA